MVQNIHPLGIKTRFLSFPLVLTLIVRPSCPLAVVVKGKDNSKPSFPFFVILLAVVFTVDIARKMCNEN